MQEIQDISIHALREEGDLLVKEKNNMGFFISIHALREEGDRAIFSASECSAQFLSTPSARRATAFALNDAKALRFLSTPSARRATRRFIKLKASRFNFYPRPPRGGRPSE